MRNHSAANHFRPCSFQTVMTTLFIISLTVSTTSSKVIISPEQQSVEVGEVAVFTCTAEDGNNSAIIWTFGKNVGDNSIGIVDNSVTVDNNRVTNKNGTLTITNTTESDDGKYYCWLNKQSPDTKKEVNLVVYVMPDYEADIIVVGCLCAGLLVVLVVVSLTKWVLNRKAKYKDILDSKRGMGVMLTITGDDNVRGFKINTVSNPEFDPRVGNMDRH